MRKPNVESLKNATPWYLKIPAKIFLSRLPVGPQRWQDLNLFRAGAMDAPEAAFHTFKTSLDATGLSTLAGRSVLELGPGNSALTAFFARSFGAARTWLVDVEKLASEDPSLLARAGQVLAANGLPIPETQASPSLEAALELLGAQYLTDGLDSLRTVADGEIDFLFSNAVMEHIRLGGFAGTVREMRRVLKPGGVASHQIDFKDHLGFALNNLRFSERLWESDFMARSGFYTNRLTWPAMKRIFQEEGFEVEVKSSQLWPGGLPTPQRKMAAPFKDMPSSELMVREVHAVLRPRR